MSFPEIQVTGQGLDITDPIREYIEGKIKKHENIFEVATSIKVLCIQSVATRGVSNDFTVEISMNLPKAIAQVKKQGEDLYALVDEATDVILRKVKKYKDTLHKWEGKVPWKIAEAGASLSLEEPENEEWLGLDYLPKIVKRKMVEDCTPMSEAEAIERMEMLGNESFIFKNKDTGKTSMVYRIKAGGYGIVELAK